MEKVAALAGFALVACGFVGSAEAEVQVPYDPVILDVCLAAGHGDDCAGIASGRCMQEEGFYSTVGMVACLNREGDHWADLLDEAFATLVDQAKSQDDELAELGSAAAKSEPQLRDMQSNWVAFRDAACGYEASRWGGGTGAGPAAAECAMRMTADQVMRLRGHIRTTD